MVKWIVCQRVVPDRCKVVVSFRQAGELQGWSYRNITILICDMKQQYGKEKVEHDRAESTKSCKIRHVFIRQYDGFQNPWGSRVRVAGVRVQVAKSVPSQNPYPQHSGTGFHGLFPLNKEEK